MRKDEISTNEVRRKLLKAVVYAPPVILGSMVATPRTAMGLTPWPGGGGAGGGGTGGGAGGGGGIGTTKLCKLTGGGTVTITISSGTNACCPCIPGSTKYDPIKCGEKQCIKSCGSNCPPGVLATIKCKKFCKTCGFTPAGCTKPCVCNATTGKCN